MSRIFWLEAMYRGLRTFGQTLGGTMLGMQITMDRSVLFKLGTAAASAAFAGAAAFLMNLGGPPPAKVVDIAVDAGGDVAVEDGVPVDEAQEGDVIQDGG